MATSPLFGWEEPDDVDLVKDGAAAMRTLGNAIDTSMGDLLGGTSGQILAKASNTNMDFTWITNDVGDITAVTAGVGINGGGTSGAVTINNSMLQVVDAKGDLVVGVLSDEVTRLPVGFNGQTLVADSTTGTGLRYQNTFAAGENKIINGDFRINQRAFTSASGTQVTSYGFDRWLNSGSGGGTITYTAQTFTAGSAPVAGYEARNYLDIQTTGQTATNVTTRLDQRIESVRTFANQTITISFWAKAASGTPKIAVELDQQFGTGGSPSARVTTYAGQVILSTSWSRYSVTIAVPSISGKTIGSNNDDYLSLNLWVSAGTDFNARTGSLGIQTNTFSIWGVQLQAGSVATAFQTATGTIQGELATCQRYYYRMNSDAGSTFAVFSQGSASSTTSTNLVQVLPVQMRVKPAVLDTSLPLATFFNIVDAAGNAQSPTALALDGAQSSASQAFFSATVGAGLTQFRPYVIRGNNNSGAYIGWSAEL